MAFVFMQVYVITKGQFLEQGRSKQEGRREVKLKQKGLGGVRTGWTDSISKPAQERI